MSMHPIRNYFTEFKKDCELFIETGTYKGDGINLAIASGFTDIRSIDIVNHPCQYEGVRAGVSITRYIDHSPTVLNWLLTEPSAQYKKTLFWLDAHSQLIEDEPDNFPLLDELKVIGQKATRKDHVILIDDILVLTHPRITGWSLETITSAINKINPNYVTELLPNPVRENILVAYIP